MMEAASVELNKLERKGSAPVKRRVSRACDHCHRMRTRCNGQAPCSRCIELEYVCQYNREKKRRGKVPRHIQKQREEAAHTDPRSPQNGNGLSIQTSSHYEGADVIPEMEDGIWSPAQPTPISQHFPTTKDDMHHVTSPRWQAMPPNQTFDGHVNHIMIDPLLLSPGEMNPYPHPLQVPMPRNEDLMFAMNEMHLVPNSGTPVSMPPEYATMSYPMHFTAVRQSSPHSYGSGDTGSPQSAASATSSHPGITPCRYPVLKPLIPHLGSIMSMSMACDLLEFYFQSSSSVFMEPVSPYILGTVFRKRSFLRQHKPRKCTPALLASLLWIAAQTSEASYLTSSPSARGVICQKLWKLTIDLLKPLVHSPTGAHGFAQGAGSMVSPAPHDAFGVERVVGRYDARMEVGISPTGTLDDVATYLNLGTVTSASEYKAASLRWLNAAWGLARELKLGRELPQDFTADRDSNGTENGEMDMGMSDGSNSGVQMPAGSPALALIEEMKEERRRLWWLLYMIDRHLGLCYNRPLAMLDSECEELYQPVQDTVWQAGEFYTGSSTPKRKGLTFQCISHDIFGFFLPLMTILGDIVDLNAQKNHPRFGQRRTSGWELHENEITLQLERYAYSLQEFKIQQGCRPSREDAANNPNGTPDPVRSEWIHQTKKVVAYGTHIMYVLHILLHGKWDPVSLLEDDNMWICSQSFLAATSNAVSAAHAVDEILELDPDLSFMPYFFGMYLLQGSLILLLLADKLQVDTNDGVIKACETIVRAHEAAVVTLNTEYQRNFRKVMISTLAQIKKGVNQHREMNPAKRREVLSLYRWTNLGNGLAI
ncbi:transcriptional activator xlnR [Lindgomyces ingoldianus]|uniref:Transcriptional activator xlnR n=1 Tax=Lindgomyces ingoldianus TaxID=673940 RepID=A0ACB6RE38_9PLEO|nr:transcriptional activator xlnR [Lindgomyces ingoldianus]KAF2476980.1 transcriptional activator xlnR [Lindgomyces ingoldianus]